MWKVVYLIGIFGTFVDSRDIKNNFLVLLPSSTLENGDEVCINFLRPFEAARNVTLSLSSSASIIYQRNLEISEPLKCITIHIPENRSRNDDRAIFRVSFASPAETFKQTVRLAPKSFISFISTNKPVYSFGEQVLIRIFNVRQSDFLPDNEKVEKVYITNPQGIHIAQWTQIKPVSGFTDLSFHLAPDPMLGTWKIIVVHRGQEHVRHFHVLEYEYPRFSLNMTLPHSIEASSTVNISVCARYAFGKPVIGVLELKTYIKCAFQFYCSSDPEISTLKLDLDENGCGVSSLTAKVFDSNHLRQYLYVNATVTESDSQHKVARSEKILVVPSGASRAITAKFHYPANRYKVGLPYHGKISFDNGGNHLQSKLAVNLCANIDDLEFCKNATTDDKGDLRFILPSSLSLIAESPKVVRIKAVWSDGYRGHAEKISFPQSWYSPSQSYLQIEEHEMELPSKCKTSMPITVVHNLPNGHSSPFYVTVKFRGRIISFEPATSMPNYRSGYREISSMENVTVLSNETNHPVTSYFSFDLDIPQAASPMLLLLVYTVREGEIVADSMNLPVETCFQRNVKAVWNQPSAVPGSPASLNISAPSNSFCSVFSTDERINYWPGDFNPNAKSIFDALTEKYRRNRLEHVDESIHRCSDPDSSATYSVLPVSNSYFMDSLEAFESIGLATLTDQLLSPRPCRPKEKMEPKRPAPFDSYDDGDGLRAQEVFSDDFALGSFTRSRFPDTWIWDIISTGSDGNANLEKILPDGITTWNTYVTCLSNETGISVADVASITGFKPFFVDFTPPPVAKRNELIHLPVTVFNYLDHTVPIMVSIAPSDHIHVKTDLQYNMCVRSKGKQTYIFHLLPVKLGKTNISVKAQVDTFADDDCSYVAEEFTIDHVLKEINIKPEGRPVEHIESALICGNDFLQNPRASSWNMKMLHTEYIDKSLKNEIRVTGDLIGPALKNLNKWIQKPMDCGEQNMFALSSNILLLQYLNARQDEATFPEDMDKILSNMKLAYQQQFSFRHVDGSYSVFGPSKSESSIWLTAFVVRYFNMLKPFMVIDEASLKESIDWIIRQQLENGCFDLVGDVQHWDFRRQETERESPRAITAFVLSSLIEGNVSVPSSVLKNAAFCIQAAGQDDVYAKLLQTYALAVTNHTRDATLLMKELIFSAKRSYNHLWWETEGGSRESSIEMTAYGIKTMLKLGGAQLLFAASDAIRWLVHLQNDNGGFLATQDTILALEAIIKYSQILPKIHGELEIYAKYADSSSRFLVNIQNKLLLQSLEMPPFLTNVQFEVKGHGCALVQTVTKYNVRRGEPGQTLKLHLRSISIPSVDDSLRRIEVCTRTKGSLNTTKMAVVEINLPTGFAPDRTSLHKITTANNGVKLWEEYEDHVDFYLEGLSNHKTCFDFLIMREVCVDNPTSAIAKVYDYYNSDHISSLRYTIQQNCKEATKNDSILLYTNSKYEYKHRLKRSLFNDRDEQEVTTIANDLQDPYDLETPKEITGPLQIFALPPPSTKGGKKCPQCLTEVPDIFSKLYCSSQLAALAKFYGEHIMEISMDLSPMRNATDIHRLVSYTMKRRCRRLCPNTEKDGYMAFLLVTPPRTFQLRSVQLLHLDDAFAIIPWAAAKGLVKQLIGNTIKCQSELIKI